MPVEGRRAAPFLHSTSLAHYRPLLVGSAGLVALPPCGTVCAVTALPPWLVNVTVNVGVAAAAKLMLKVCVNPVPTAAPGCQNSRRPLRRGVQGVAAGNHCTGSSRVLDAPSNCPVHRISRSHRAGQCKSRSDRSRCRHSAYARCRHEVASAVISPAAWRGAVVAARQRERRTKSPELSQKPSSPYCYPSFEWIQ